MSKLLAYITALDTIANTCGNNTSYAFIVEHGRIFNPPRNPRPKGLKKGKDKRCYQNTTNLVLSTPSLIYCEGFAIPSNISLPLAHAWGVTEDGNVIETTWQDSGAEYFGIPFNKEYLLTSLETTQRYGLLDTYYNVDLYQTKNTDFKYTFGG